MKPFRVLLTPGDGIGPEVIAAAVTVLRAVERRFDVRFELEHADVGGAAIERHGVPLRPETLERARDCDAVLFGAVGDPRFEDRPLSQRPERAVLGLRKELGLYANLRPVRGGLASDRCPLRPELARDVDLVVVRELTGGLYFGQPKRSWSEDGNRRAVDTMAYDEQEIRRLLHSAFALATRRRGHVTSVDKANGLECSKLWRTVADEVHTDYPDVELRHMLVDACAMHLLRQPQDFDVIATANLFGDILTDEASMLSGALGLMPSASLGPARSDGRTFGLYEPIHGSAPDIAGRGVANPIGAIASAAMMLRISLGLDMAASAVEEAIGTVLDEGRATPDIARAGVEPCTTEQLADAVADAVASTERHRPSP